MANGATVHPEIPTTETCSKCGEERDTTGFPRWCKACRAKYKREYESVRKDLTESRGYAAGVSAMREYLSAQFYKLGSGHFEGREVARLISQSKGPFAS